MSSESLLKTVQHTRAETLEQKLDAKHQMVYK